MSIHFPLYTLDSRGKRRFWQMEVDGSCYRTISGLVDGKKTVSGWTTATPKNVGRANATTAEQQALAEVEAEYRKKLDRKYHEDLDAVSGVKFNAPMLAQKYDGWKWPHGRVWSQPKLDGIRCIATKDGLSTRQGKPIASCPHVVDALAKFFEHHPDAILDGELYNHDLRADFGTIASLVRKTKPSSVARLCIEESIQYHVYDCFNPNLFGLRKAWLDSYLVPYLSGYMVRIVETRHHLTEDDLDAAYGDYLAAGYEGQMVRLEGFPYETAKRSASLLKRKEFQDAEFPVVAIEEGNGNWAGLAKRAVLRLPDGRSFGAGIKGDREFAKQLLTGPTPSGATIRYFALTPDGVPRFPVAVDFQFGLEGRQD